MSPLRSTTLTLFFCLPACGGVVTTTPPERADSGSTSNDARHDARHEASADAHREPSADALANVCPISRPTAGAECAVSDIDCEYGSDPELACDTLMDCLDGGWASSGPADAGCATTNSALCPAMFSAITQDGACAIDAGGLAGVECYYPEARCWCSLGTAPATWQCDTDTSTSCPEPRPRIGSPCEATDVALACNYASCLVQICRLGSWQFFYACGK
jgi:hypothetical protein